MIDTTIEHCLDPIPQKPSTLDRLVKANLIFHNKAKFLNRFRQISKLLIILLANYNLLIRGGPTWGHVGSRDPTEIFDF